MHWQSMQFLRHQALPPDVMIYSRFCRTQDSKKIMNIILAF